MSLPKLKWKVTPVTAIEGLEDNSLFVRPMSGLDMENYQDLLKKDVKLDADGKATNISTFAGERLRVLAKTLCDKDGELIIKTKEEEKELMGWDTTILDSLFTQAMKVNGFSKPSEAAVVAEVKNSEAAPT